MKGAPDQPHAHNLNTKAGVGLSLGKLVPAHRSAATTSGSAPGDASRVTGAFGLGELTAFFWQSGSPQLGPKHRRGGRAVRGKPQASAFRVDLSRVESPPPHCSPRRLPRPRPQSRRRARPRGGERGPAAPAACPFRSRAAAAAEYSGGFPAGRGVWQRSSGRGGGRTLSLSPFPPRLI